MTDASHGHSFDSSCPMIALIAVMIPLIAMMRALIIGALKNVDVGRGWSSESSCDCFFVFVGMLFFIQVFPLCFCEGELQEFRLYSLPS